MLSLTSRLSKVLFVVGLCSVLFACGGSRPETGNPGVDAGGGSCQFDSDCNPPNTICGATGTCDPGCTIGGCITGKVCNSTTGRCGSGSGTDGGNTDGGGTDGGTTDGGGGTASDTLCQPCTVNGDCHGGGICVSNTAHTSKYCTQDCTTDACPDQYQCTTDSTGTRHQCFPTTDCATTTGQNDGGTTTGTDAGTGTNDPTVPSDNPTGCKMCGECTVNNDCIQGSFCLNGICATPCDTGGFLGTAECILTGGSLFSQCADVGLPNGQMLCVPLLGACFELPSPLTPLSGDVSCVPSGTNPTCSAPSIPNPLFGNNTLVSGNLNPAPQLTEDPAIVETSANSIAVAFMNVDSSSKSVITVCSSTDDGATFGNCTKVNTSISGAVQADPAMAVTKWSDGTGTHERITLVWLAYVLQVSGGTATPTNMTIEGSFSDDGGKTWAAGTKITTSADNNNGALQIDKPQIAAGADGTLAVTFSVSNSGQQHAYATISTDHGASWIGKKALYSSTELGDNNHGHTLTAPAFDTSDATGNTIYAVYVKYTTAAASNTNTIELVKSTDKGSTWVEQGTVSNSGDQVFFDAPSISIDKSHRLYVGYSAAAAASNATFWDANVALVDISGATPTVVRHTRVSDDSGNCFQHFHVTVANDGASSVYAGWLDNRDNGKGDAWLAKSGDQAASFGSGSIRVSSTNFEFNPDSNNAQTKTIGDYAGLIYANGKVRMVWGDPRNASSSSGSQIFYGAGAP
ncbi:MAG: exo-alpha-sialidase [Deltaproteobacteria bacterium]|nr:exo-alpha-sialidase [Deltaproteobacteria bacterium]